MARLSKRSARVPESPFRKLAGLGRQAKKEGVRVYHLNIGQPDIPTPPGALERFKRELPKVVAYSPGEGDLQYRLRLSGYYARFGLDITPEDLLITVGGSEALQLLLYTLGDIGDEFLVPEPYYANYEGFARVADVQLVALPSSAEAGFPIPAIADFAARLTERTRGILINNPGNPTGSCYAPEEVRTLIEWATERDLFVVVDEVYREFVYDGRQPFCSLALRPGNQQVIIVDSISKRFSSCGARVGNIATFNRELLATLGRYAKLRLSAPALGQLLAGCILEEEGNYLEEVIAEYDRRRRLIFRRLSAMPGVETYLPGGAFYSFARLPVPDAEIFCRYLLEDYRYEGATVMLSPGPAFHARPEQGVNLVRLAFVLQESDLNTAMDILENALATYPERMV